MGSMLSLAFITFIFYQAFYPGVCLAIFISFEGIIDDFWTKYVMVDS